VKKFRAISLAVILGLTISSVPAVAVPKPTVAEIEAAKKVEAAKKKIADAQAKKLAAANQSLRALTAKANAAAAVYRKAQAELAVQLHLLLLLQNMPQRLQQQLQKRIKLLVAWHQMLTSWAEA